MTEESADDLIRALLEAPDGPSALQAISKLGRARVGLSHLWDQTEHRYARFRAAAFEAMAEFSDEDTEGSEPFVLRGLEDENPFVSTAAARAAASLGIAGAAPLLRQQTKHHNRYVRSAACLALGPLGTADDFDLLAEVLRTDDDERVLERAARALGRLGSRIEPPTEIRRATLEFFDIATKLGSPARWQAVRGLLGLLRHVELDAPLRDLLLGLLTDVGVRGEAARVLGTHGVEAARSIIESHLPAEPSPRLRNELIRALGDLGPEPSLEVLLSLLDAPLDTSCALTLIGVLAEVDDDSAVAAVLRLAAGPDVAVRSTALRIVPRDHPLRVDLALAGLGDPAASVRTAAARVLADRPDLLDELRTALDQEEVPEARLALAEAIRAAATAAPPPSPFRHATERPALLRLLPHGQSVVDEAVRSVIVDSVAHGLGAAGVADALEELARNSTELAAAYRNLPS